MTMIDPMSHRLLKNRPDVCDRLTDQQLRVVKGIVDGLSAPQISQELGRTENTVHCHIKAIYRKLGVKNRVHLVLLFTHQEVPA